VAEERAQLGMLPRAPALQARLDDLIEGGDQPRLRGAQRDELVDVEYAVAISIGRREEMTQLLQRRHRRGGVRAHPAAIARVLDGGEELVEIEPSVLVFVTLVEGKPNALRLCRPRPNGPATSVDLVDTIARVGEHLVEHGAREGWVVHAQHLQKRAGRRRLGCRGRPRWPYGLLRLLEPRARWPDQGRLPVPLFYPVLVQHVHLTAHMRVAMRGGRCGGRSGGHGSGRGREYGGRQQARRNLDGCSTLRP